MKQFKSIFQLLMAVVLAFGAISTLPVKHTQAFAADLFFSEYIEGSSNNKALEIFNGTGATVDLMNYKVILYSNGASTPGNTLIWTTPTPLINGEVYVIANAGANSNILAQADVTSTVTYYNGDDAVALQRASDNSFVDVIGDIGFDPGTVWGVGDVTTGEHTLVRKCGITTGDSISDDDFIPALEWDGFVADTFVYLGSHTTCWGPAADPAPTVSSTTPANNATMVALASNIEIVFSEAVNATASAFSVSCPSSGTHTFALNTSDNITFSLDPDSDFVEGEVCTVTVLAAQVTDQDEVDPEDAMLADYSFSFTTFLTDAIPSVVSTVPLSNAPGVAVADDLSVTFSEIVNGVDGAVSVTCAYSGPHAVMVDTTESITYTINPDVDFTQGEKCTVTLESTLITDSSAQQMAADYVWSFTTYYDQDAPVPIAVARAGGALWTGTIQGNVTLLPGLLGAKSFSIQDATGGMYVYPLSSATLPSMALGDVVRVKGTVKNYNTLLEIDPVASVTWISAGTVPDPLPVDTNAVGPTQGKLIEVQGTINFTTTPPAPGTNFSFTIDDGSGPVMVYVYRLTNIDMRGYTSGQQLHIVGISNAYTSGPQLQPRFQTDIIELSAPVVSSTIPLADAVDVSPHKPISAIFNKSMDTDSLGNFTLTADSGTTSISGLMTYNDATHTATFTPDSALAPDTLYTATFPVTVTDSYGMPLAVEYSWSFTSGALDTTPPVITAKSPLPDATDVSSGTLVSVTFSEDLATSSLNLGHFILTDEAIAVVPATFNYDPITQTVSLNPDPDLAYSTTYTIKVTFDTADLAGNPLGADEMWSFTTMTEPPMQAYFGDIHNHTSISDGSGTPAQALAAGEAAGFDFMAISDHSYAIDDGEWATTLAAVEAATDSNFVALRGYEYTQGAEGHINVYNSVYHATRVLVSGCTFCVFTPNLEAGTTVKGFYPWIVSAENTAFDSAGMVMQFNHPGWINFNDWFFHPEASGIARLEEVGNGNGSSYVFSEAEFIRSLDSGWKVGATNNADTHTTEWGMNTEHRTGVLMPELTKTALMEALHQRRTFATEDMNFSLSMKANNAWMGSEITNTGTIDFEIDGVDADGELVTLVEVITDHGAVVNSLAPNTSSFTWDMQLTITPGVHYYYVKVTQADGDRIVSSPVWTTGTADISITDLTIQPTIPTTHNASLLSVRVTHRSGDVASVNVVLSVDGVQLGAPVAVTITPNGDSYAFFSWQPTVTGPVTITAEIQGAPAGDNPDDNVRSLDLIVTDILLPLILIDAGHGNLNTAGNEMKPFIDDLSAHNYNVLKNLDALTTADLNPAVVKLLMISAPELPYTPDELSAIATYVAAGGSLWMGGLADYNKSVLWANTVADRENAILAAIETATGQQINMRMNDDEVIDGNTNNGYVFGVIFQDFPGAASTGIGMNVESVATWSLSSLRGRTVSEPLTASTPGVQIVMQGDLDVGCTTDSYHNPFHTSNTDYDAAGDAYMYNPGFTCGLTQPPVDAIPLPAAAVTQLENGAGRIMLYGDSNDPFTIFAYTAGDGKQNELFNLQSVMWLLGDPLAKSTIAEARAQAVEDVPDNLDKVVWVEGIVTAAYGEFFNVLYVQDETGGITVHAPAGDIDATSLTRGTKVRVVGTIGIYNGDTEVEFFEAEMVQVLEASTGEPVGLPLTTQAATLESNEGWLTAVSGLVIGKPGLDTLIVNDGSGPVRVFLDGYNGNFDDIELYDLVQVIGLVSEDGLGSRIRIRNYKFHAGVPDDLILTGHQDFDLLLPVVFR